MSQTWIRGPVCGVDNCRSTLYRLNAGRKFCQFGHLMEGSVEVDDDDGDNYTQTRRLNIQLTDTGFGSSASNTPAHIEKREKITRAYGKEGRLLHVKCLQIVLQKILPLFVKKAYPRLDKEKTGSFLRQVNALVKLFWLRFCKATYTEGRASILDLYVLIYLAIRKINRYPIYMNDVLHMLKLNSVPFVNAGRLIPTEIARQLGISSFLLLSASKIPFKNELYKTVVKIANMVDPEHENWSIGLEYFYPDAFRQFGGLSLDACQLLTLYHRMGTRIFNGKLQLTHKETGLVPEARAVALMVLVIKLYFVGSPQVPKPEAFLDGLQNDSNIPCFETPYHSMELEQVLKLDEESTLQYFLWVYDNLTPEAAKNNANQDDLPIMQRRLFRIFPWDAAPAELPARKQIPLPSEPLLVENKLSRVDIATLEEKLVDFMSHQYGLKPKTMRAMVSSLEEKFFRVLREDKLTMDIL